MSDPSTRVSPCEIADFMAALRCRTTGDRAALLAWKSSILDRIADTATDAETRAVADEARAELSAARATDANGGGR